MSYVVLARKYRPRRFGEMVGQEHVVQALTNALTQQRLHHAYLFTGTRGIGKTTVSRILAKSLNCTGADGQGGITAEPCGVCQACTEIDADRYLDYTEMDAASHGGKDEIRELIERAAYKPGIGRFKVFMIDEAHQLTKDAFNALLKTLEEPPEYLKFVLATTDPEKMLPTVLSRCLQFNLRPMAPATVRVHLQQVLQSENVPADDASLRLLARAARGSMRDALSLTDQAIAYGSGRLEEAVVRAMLGAVDRGHARAIVEACARRDGAVLLETVDALRGQGLSPSGTLDELALLLQQMAVEQAVPGALDSHDPETADARALAPLLGGDETQLLYSIVLHGRAELSLLGDEYAALSMVLLRFLAFPALDAGAAQRVASAREVAPASRSAALRAPAPAVASVDPARVRSPTAALPQAGGISTTATRPATPAPASAQRQPPQPDVGVSPPVPGGEAATARPMPVAEPPVPSFGGPVSPASAGENGVEAAAPLLSRIDAGPAALADRWDALARRLAEQGAIAALVRELAWQGGLVAIDETQQPPVWRVQVERDTLQAPALRDKLAAALEAALGAPVALIVEPGVTTDSPARRDAAERRRRQAHAEAVVREDPVVRDLLAQFKGARIVPGSIRPV